MSDTQYNDMIKCEKASEVHPSFLSISLHTSYDLFFSTQCIVMDIYDNTIGFGYLL